MVVYYYFFSEIKNRFFLLFLTGLSVAAASYLYKEVLLFFICSNSQFSFIYTSITEIFSIYIKLISFITNQVFIIFFFFHFLVFVAPGLYDKEYYQIKFLFYLSVCLLVLSVLLFNIALFPLSCEFFLSFQNATFKPLSLYFEAKIDDYFRFYVVLHCLCYFYFQIFIFLAYFFYFFDQELKEIKLFRKLFYFLFCLLSLTLIPDDIFGQVVTCFMLTLCYELLVFNFLLVKSAGTLF